MLNGGERFSINKGNNRMREKFMRKTKRKSCVMRAGMRAGRVRQPDALACSNGCSLAKKSFENQLATLSQRS